MNISELRLQILSALTAEAIDEVAYTTLLKMLDEKLDVLPPTMVQDVLDLRGEPLEVGKHYWFMMSGNTTPFGDKVGVELIGVEDVDSIRTAYYRYRKRNETMEDHTIVEDKNGSAYQSDFKPVEG